jgi:hypothetical protein
MGSVLSLRSTFIVGSGISLMSSSGLKLGKGISTIHRFRSGMNYSSVNFASFGSSVSLRGGVKAFGSCSILTFAGLESVLSCRSFTNLGSSLSVFGQCICASAYCLSVVQRYKLGSSISLRASQKASSILSSFALLIAGSTLSLRSVTKYGSNISINFKMQQGHQTLSGLSEFSVASSLSVRGYILGIGSKVSLCTV